MKTLVILNGECRDYLFLKQLAIDCDYIVCADGGYRHAVKAGIRADVVVGDFDSSEKPSDVKTVVFPVEKDLNDAEIAIEYAKNNFGGEIIMTCTGGGRPDHTFFNTFLMVKYEKVRLQEENVIAFLCDASVSFEDYEGKTVSFLPIGEANISLSGFKYNIENKSICIGQTLTLSNIALKDAKLTVNSGKVIAFISDGE